MRPQKRDEGGVDQLVLFFIWPKEEVHQIWMPLWLILKLKNSVDSRLDKTFMH